MTETPEQQPTNADLLAFMSEGFAHVMNEISGVKADVADVRRDLSDAKDELRGEIQASEANLVSRVNAVQEVVRSVKADVARHVGDGGAHHRHAA